MKPFLWAVSATITFNLISSAAFAASVLYGSVNDKNDYSISETIYTINQETGLATPLGDSGFPVPVDLTSDWRAESFRIWSLDYYTNQLLEIDPQTGAGTVIGSFGTATTMEALAFDPISEKLFGTTEDDLLYEIDPATGNSTFIGSVGYGSLFALAFDLTGTLYAVADDGNWLISIDTVTGTGTAVANTDSYAITDIAARPEDGVMFAVDSVRDTLLTIDLETGQTETVGRHFADVERMVGLAFSPIPEPTTSILMSFGILAILSRRRMNR